LKALRVLHLAGLVRHTGLASISHGVLLSGSGLNVFALRVGDTRKLCDDTDGKQVGRHVQSGTEAVDEPIDSDDNTIH
jgi:hypothetical protein